MNPSFIETEIKKRIYGTVLADFVASCSDMSFFEAYVYLYEELCKDNEAECNKLTIVEGYEDWPWSMVFDEVCNRALVICRLLDVAFTAAKTAMVADAKKGVFDAFDMNTLDLMHYVEEGLKPDEVS